MTFIVALFFHHAFPLADFVLERFLFCFLLFNPDVIIEDVSIIPDQKPLAQQQFIQRTDLCPFIYVVNNQFFLSELYIELYRYQLSNVLLNPLQVIFENLLFVDDEKVPDDLLPLAIRWRIVLLQKLSYRIHA